MAVSHNQNTQNHASRIKKADIRSYFWLGKPPYSPSSTRVLIARGSHKLPTAKAGAKPWAKPTDSPSHPACRSAAAGSVSRRTTSASTSRPQKVMGDSWTQRNRQGHTHTNICFHLYIYIYIYIYMYNIYIYMLMYMTISMMVIV